jgi:serine/threonine protein kinase/tetratricopeptide (TPR) repeat protein
MADPLETPADESTLTASPGRVHVQLTARPGDRFGRYKILEEIGQGGCGAIFVAEQEEPVRRRVALKVIKLGMDTRQVIARFEAERQALAMMDHPNIAKVLDAGATDSGRPFFVMELVRGIKITDYCDQNKLSTSDRLKLFIQVCQAVQHAHQKGIIHRDIKPSNILVTLQDGAPVPKVIDFGIAKATENQKLTDKTVYTAFEQFIGTPAYMSPEQADMGGVDVDTRSDIYSLGILLYELLVGETPFSSEELLGVGLDAMRRILREKDPARPSTKLSTMTGADLTAIALHRQSEALKLIKSIRGDLDWIVMKCLEKDRARRYETANGLARDITRHLNCEPVIARPPSTLYRLQKSVRRNKIAVAATSAVVAALVIGLGIFTWMFIKERADRQRAVASEQRAETVSKFFKDMLKGVDPIVALGRDTTVLRGILDKTAERVGRELANQPSVEAELLSTIGQTYNGLGEYAKAEEMHRRALRLRKELFGETNQLVAASLHDLAADLNEQQGKFAEAETLLRQAVKLRRLLCGKESPEVAESLTSLADALGHSDGRLAEAEILQREALGIQKRLHTGARPEVVASLENLGLFLQYQGGFPEAESVEREALAMSRELWGDENPEVAMLLGRLGYLTGNRGNQDEADKLERQALSMRRKVLGNDHPYVAISLDNLAIRLLRAGQLDEAEPLIRECLSIREKKFPGQWETFLTRGKLGTILLRQGKYAEAESLLVSGCEGMRQHVDPSSTQSRIDLREAVENLILVNRITGKRDQEPQWRKEITNLYREEAEQSRHAADLGDANALNSLAWLLATCGEAEIRDGPSAVLHAERAVAATSRTNGMLLDTLAAAYAETGQFEKAASVQREAISLVQNEGENSELRFRLAAYEGEKPYHEDGIERRIARSLVRTAYYLLGQGKLAQAEQPLEEALTQTNQARPEDIIDALSLRAGLRARRGQWRAAASDLARVVEADPSKHWSWYVLAPLLVLAGDLPAYQQECHAMLTRFGKTDNLMIAERTAKVCLLQPGAVTTEELAIAQKLAARAVDAGQDSPWLHWFELTKGLALYRLGDFEGASEWMGRIQNHIALARDDARDMCEADSYFVLAMARFRANEREQARAALDHGLQIVQNKLPRLDRGDLGASWQNAAMTYIFMREAKGLADSRLGPTE